MPHALGHEEGRSFGRPFAVTGRFAPSPSGRMHLGNVFSALIGWLAVRAAGGRMVLRIEDLDPRTQRPEVAAQLIDDLAWLGLDWDEGPIYQHEHGERYARALGSLDSRGLLYPCFCTRRELHAASAPHASDGTYVYSGTCRRLSREERIARLAEGRPYGLRLLVPDSESPNAVIEFEDEVYGPQRQDLVNEVGDILVERSDGVVAYQLAVVVDDGDEGVSLVVRGRDLLDSTARQIYLQRLLGCPQPHYLHIPMLVAPDGRRLSKRERDLDLGALRAWLPGPEPLLGCLAATVGFAEPGEALSASALVERFSLASLISHREDIVVDERFLARLGGPASSIS